MQKDKEREILCTFAVGANCVRPRAFTERPYEDDFLSAGKTCFMEGTPSQVLFSGGGWWIRDHILALLGARTTFRSIFFRVPRFLRRTPRPTYSHQAKKHCFCSAFRLVGDGGFGPPKSVTTDLQSAPFGRSGNPPYWSW